MNRKHWVTLGVVASAVVAVTVWAVVDGDKTFRTPAILHGVFQGTDLAGKPAFQFEDLAGRDLVNLALGTPLGTVRTNEVLAMTFDCEGTEASLVVFDKTADTVIATIATSSSFDVVRHQDNAATPFPNREKFVALLNIGEVGNATDGLLGGFLTVAGRLHLNPETGCPRAVLVDFDRLKDKIFADRSFRNAENDGDRLIRFAGRDHMIGVLDLVSGGTTNTVLVPYGQMLILRQLSP